MFVFVFVFFSLVLCLLCLCRVCVCVCNLVLQILHPKIKPKGSSAFVDSRGGRAGDAQP